MTGAIDIRGRRFGELTAIEVDDAPVDGRPRVRWLCRCDCGRELSVRSDALRRGASTCCGCSRRRTPPNVNRRHGLSKIEENAIWRSMIARCTIPSDTNYEKYGKRGISVCDRWLNSFEAFLEDMGRRLSPHHSIERKDNNGSYDPTNCIWATREEQGSNKRNNHLISRDGETKTLAQWARCLGIPRERIAKRLHRGLSPEIALSPGLLKSETVKHTIKTEIQRRLGARKVS